MTTIGYAILILCALLACLTIVKRLIAINELDKRIDEFRDEEKRRNKPLKHGTGGLSND